MHTANPMEPRIFSVPEKEKIRILCATPQRIRLRNAFCEFAESYEPTAYIHLITNQTYSVHKMQKLINDFFGRFDRKIVGSDWQKKPAHKRTHGLACIEHMHSNIHAHCAVSVPKGHLLQHQLLGQEIWQKLCPPGSIQVDPVNDIVPQTSYVIKEMTNPKYDWDEQFMIIPTLNSAKKA